MRTARTILALVVPCLAAGCGDDGPPVMAMDTFLEFTPLEIPADAMGYVGAVALPGRPDEMLLAEIFGRIVHVRVGETALEVLGSWQMPLDPPCTALSITLDPDWETNGFVYLGLCATLTGSEIARVTFDGASYDGVAATKVQIFLADEPLATRPWHQVGSMGFFDDGSMWALFGEQLRSENAQDTTNDLGKILRIIPSRDPTMGGYTPSPGNPFAGSTIDSPNIWAWGVRSPWRGALDTEGRLWLGDVGEDSFEEVDALTMPGMNLGWPVHEGPCLGLDCSGYAQPIVSWSHGDDDPFVLEDELTEITTARLAYVGLEYVPAATDRYEGRLMDRMIYGDMCAGWVRTVQVDAGMNIVEDRLVGHRAFISQWVLGADDYLYVPTLGVCEDPTRPAEGPGFYRVVMEGG